MEFFSQLLPEDPQHLLWLDYALNILHFTLVCFVVFGAFFKKLVPVHFPVLLIIWLSWCALGYYLDALGYCPLTDWHWQVKYRQGQVNLPPSYIEYCYGKITGQDVDNALISNITAGVMLVVTIFSGYRFFKWFKPKKLAD